MTGGEFGSSVLVEFVTGAGAAVVDCCLFHSIDTLKVRKQDGRPLLPWERLRAASAFTRPAISLGSLYQGFSTNLFLKVPYMATMFGFHAFNKTLLDAISGGGDDDQGMTSKTREFVSAFLVGIEASLLLSPLELVRIQGQNRGKGGLLEASRYTLSEIGARGVMTTGMHACMQREAKYCVGQFALVGAISSAIADWAAAHRFDASPSPSAASASASSAPSVFSSAGVATVLDESLDLRTLVSSIGVGFACTIISQPDDVVKTRQQTRIGTAFTGAYRSYLGSIAHVASTEGARALWRGAFWRCCVRVPLGLSVINYVHPRLRPFAEAACGGE